ncbi:MAG: S8 family serine peptidase [Acidobacteriota bacterium]|nr:S8 family serine peptidase [Acidobacteriota bacterium]
MKPPTSRIPALTFFAIGLLITSPLLADTEYELHLGGVTFDPLVDPLPVDFQWYNQPVGPDLQLVQFFGPTQESWLEALAGIGAEVVQYIHPYTYVVWADLADLEDFAEQQPSVRWVGHFQPAFRVLPQWRTGGNLILRDALLYAGSDIELALDLLEQMGAGIKGSAWLDDRFLSIGLRIAQESLPRAAKIPGIYTIQDQPIDGGPRSEMSSQVNANNVDASNYAFPGYQNWLTGIGLDGSGVIITNVDLGFQDDHPDLVHNCLPCVGETCGTANSAHGTLAAAIMVGSGESGAEDGNGFLRGLGVAPGAGVIEQLSGYHKQPGGMLTLIRGSRQNGASLSSNSWGAAGSPRGYDGQTMQVDLGVRDADESTPGNQGLTYVLSIMNGFGGTSTQGSPDEAKNAITVGSTKLQYFNGQQNPAIYDLSHNTAHGPALDGRKIPHLVAPGCMVESASTQGTHELGCGTSLAAPQVSGAAALFIEHFRNLFSGADPSPAMVKAAIVAGARDLAGGRDANRDILGHRFDSRQGWGRLDLEKVVGPGTLPLYFDAPYTFGATGEEWTAEITSMDPTRPVEIMLVWTDAAGHGLGGLTPAWNNNLDLVVEDGTASYLGNEFGADGFSVPGGSPDGINNTEGVVLAPGPERLLTIRVSAANINSDGIPGVGDGTDQDFALVCYNCSDPPRFAAGRGLRDR